MGQIKIFTDIRNLVTMQGARAKLGRHILPEDLSVLPKAAMVTQAGKLVWVGPEAKIPKKWILAGRNSNIKQISLKGTTVLPGFVECHTHAVFAGSRAEEFEWRLQGASYQDIAARGGGILSTMRETRKTSLPHLRDLLLPRIEHFLQQGVTTLEVKSGYGLNKNCEIKMLKSLRGIPSIRIVPTFLGAHALPPEFSNYEVYLQYLLDQVLPEIQRQKLSQRVDIFIEKGFFEINSGRRYLQRARKMGFEVLIHADQLSLSGGTELAVELGARSADHVIQIQAREIKMLAQSETTAVLLPLSDLYMKCFYPPARTLIEAGARVAVATDYNPGSSPSQDIMLTGLLARLHMGMTLAEVLCAYTVGAAFALGLEDQAGVLAPGYSADFMSTYCDWQELFYSAGKEIPSQVFTKGVLRH